MIKYKIGVYVEWISSQSNLLADTISRKNITEFKRFCTQINIQINQYPSPYAYFKKLTFMNNHKPYNEQESLDEEYLRFCDWIEKDPQKRPDVH